MKRLMFEWSAMKPLTNFPAAYMKSSAEPTIPNCVASSSPESMIGFFITLRLVRQT